MDTILLNKDTWDLTLDARRSIASTTSGYALAQETACALRSFAGENWYDTTRGIPYWAQILGEIPPISYIRAVYEAECLKIPEIVQAHASLVLTGRTLTGTVAVTATNGLITTVNV